MAAAGGRRRPAHLEALVTDDNCLYTRIVRFEWDPAKAAANRRAHGVTFAEAVTVLEDTFALTREDPDASEERRFVTLGMSDQAKLLVVVDAYRGHDRIRIISALKASKHQRESYEENCR